MAYTDKKIKGNKSNKFNKELSMMNEHSAAIQEIKSFEIFDTFNLIDIVSGEEVVLSVDGEDSKPSSRLIKFLKANVKVISDPVEAVKIPDGYKYMIGSQSTGLHGGDYSIILCKVPGILDQVQQGGI